MHKLRTLHLFAGAGGGILADILLGHQPVCAVEIDTYCQQVLHARQKDGSIPWFPIFGDVKEFDGRPWRGLIDVVCGGFPCQNISPSGDRTGLEGDKSSLWFEMLRIICEARPTYIFVENSAALTFRGLSVVLRGLAKVGYDARWGVLGASDAMWIDGTPAFDHLRLRTFIKAYDPHRVRELQSKRRIRDKWRRISNGIEQTSDPNGSRWKGEEPSKEISENINGVTSPFERFRNRVSMPTASTNSGWWANEPGVGRVVHGLANRNDRIKSIGNGQVPAVVKIAWQMLT